MGRRKNHCRKNPGKSRDRILADVVKPGGLFAFQLNFGRLLAAGTEKIRFDQRPAFSKPDQIRIFGAAKAFGAG